MSAITKLVNNGKFTLGEDQVFNGIWLLFDSFFKVVRSANYTTEKQLLPLLEKWANNSPFYTAHAGNAIVRTGAVKTHKLYVHGVTGYREFGDVTYVTVFRKPSQNLRIAFANTFQIKVDSTELDAYKKLFEAMNKPQLEFYRKDFLEELQLTYNPLICDFLHYLLIGGKSNHHTITEIPLSVTWLQDSSGTYWQMLPAIFSDRSISNSNGCTGIDNIITKMFLTTGINVDFLLNYCYPKLKSTLENILSFDVDTAKNKSMNEPNEPKYEDKKPLEDENNRISSSIVIATDVLFKE